MVILTKLKKEEFERILENYNIGRYKSHKHIWWALENTVYILKTSKGMFILKIFERSDLDFIRYQVRIIDFLQDKKLPIPKIIKTKLNKNLLIYENKKILIQKFVEGDEPNKINNKLTKDLGKSLGLLDKSLLKLKLNGDYIWGDDYHFSPINKKRGVINRFNFRKYDDSLITELKKLKKSKLRKSVVHGDFHSSNLLAKNDKIVAIIDWDDTHEDFIVFEVAVLIAHSFITKKEFKRDQIRLFLKEYQRYIRLNKEERKAIYYFIKQRYLGVIDWCVKQRTRHKDKHGNITKWLDDITKRYYNFDKISLEDFMGLF